MFTIMIWLSRGKTELRVIRHDAIYPTATLFACHHHSGVPWTLQLPPGVESFDDLPRFDDVDAAWQSVRDDYCPSLHP